MLLIIDISKHGAKEMGHVKMAGPGFVNDVTSWWPGFVQKNIINKQEPKQQKSTGSSFCGTLSLISQLIYDDIAKMFHLTAGNG
jgi:hypothetical protein